MAEGSKGAHVDNLSETSVNNEGEDDDDINDEDMMGADDLDDSDEEKKQNWKFSKFAINMRKKIIKCTFI